MESKVPFYSIFFKKSGVREKFHSVILSVGNVTYDELVTACLCLLSLAPTNTIHTFSCLIFKKSPLFPGYFRLGQNKTRQTFIHLMDNNENINYPWGVQNYSYSVSLSCVTLNVTFSLLAFYNRTSGNMSRCSFIQCNIACFKENVVWYASDLNAES